MPTPGAQRVAPGLGTKILRLDWGLMLVVGAIAAAGFLMLYSVAGGSLGCGTLIFVLIAVLLGADLQSILGLVGGSQQQAQVDQQPTATPPSDDAGEFTSVIL
ncbi:MAG: neutral zinc metallopeptidase, partial [Myxococcota bacterium]